MRDSNRRRRILVNGEEFQTDQALRDAVVAAGYRLDAKVRLADALPIDGSGLSPRQYGFAMRSHFDWVISDAETTEPEFAVEFDGPSHEAEESRARDALKDEICERLDLPLLRIGRVVLRPFRERTILAVLINAWSFYKAFAEAQDSGILPLDEPYDPYMSLDGHYEGNQLIIEQRFNIAQPAEQLLWKLRRSDEIVAWRDAKRPTRGNIEAYAWAYLRDGGAVLGEALVRQCSFPAFLDFDLAGDLATMALGDRLQQYLEGDLSVRVSETALATRIPEPFAKLETHFSIHDMPGWSFGAAG
ncbi:MAG: DUF2726 domain-containing protein [Chloroflexota bacterium]|nr:DUF2726 domain-containing protein [Chloroflexota bacterium]